MGGLGLLGLAVVLVVGLAGPLLATPRRARIPVVIGEILAGVLVGHTGFGWVNPDEPVLSFLASAGFALVMLVAGSHVPLRHPALRQASGAARCWPWRPRCWPCRPASASRR